MFPTGFRVVVDACALYPLNVRDVLLRSAEAGLYQLHWSAQILDEVLRNLVENGAIDPAKAAGLGRAMEEAFPESMVEGYEDLIPAMRNDEGDRHVAAAAVKSGAQVIVTYNLRDFKNLPSGIEAQSPDDFLGNLFDLDRDLFVEILRRQAADRTRPPISLEQMLEAMTVTLPDLVAAVRQHIG